MQTHVHTEASSGASGERSETRMFSLLSQQLLKDSVQLQERFRLLQSKDELLDSAFGPERSDSLHHELAAAVRNRELLHSQLLQRKSRLQVSGEEGVSQEILNVSQKY